MSALGFLVSDISQLPSGFGIVSIVCNSFILLISYTNIWLSNTTMSRFLFILTDKIGLWKDSSQIVLSRFVLLMRRYLEGDSWLDPTRATSDVQNNISTWPISLSTDLRVGKQKA